jgi:hypothetical protein
MIVKILSRGKSFKGLATYLTHDPEANTDERVAWTHTFNLANDHVPSAVDEMVWTARNAELLKQEAGVRAGGRATENSVKHLSLNWAPDQRPTQEHMIETTEEFLRHMKWQEHQAVVVAHQDKHAHVHVMLNVVHPETGLRLDDNFERRRAQAWALEYEKAQGHIYCEQRLNDPAAREDAPPRNVWAAFHENQNEFEAAEKSLRQNEPILVDDEKNQRNAEWKMLKEMQRAERTEFFAEGKSEFSQLRLSIYREVREEFRERWADFYATRREGADPDTLAALKAELVADQKAVLESRRDEACDELRESRKGRYRELLDGQMASRAELRSRQEGGLDNGPFLQALEHRHAEENVAVGFREAADQAATPRGGSEGEVQGTTLTGWFDNDDSHVEGGRNADDVGLRVGFSVGSLLDALFFDLTNLGSAPPPRQEKPGPGERDPFKASAEEARKQEQQRERDEAEARARQRSPYGD